MLEERIPDPCVAGMKQTRRALNAGQVARLLIARDADPALTAPLAELAKSAGVPVDEGNTMADLGAICGIAVGAACCAFLK